MKEVYVVSYTNFEYNDEINYITDGVQDHIDIFSNEKDAKKKASDSICNFLSNNNLYDYTYNLKDILDKEAVDFLTKEKIDCTAEYFTNAPVDIRQLIINSLLFEVASVKKVKVNN